MVLACLYPAQAQQSKQLRPNIIFILIDDLRWDELGCTGHPFVNTPNIDRIAREGAMFRNAFMTTPLCSPSRASFLTGQYAHAHGITDNVDRSAASHQLVTFPLLLHRSGYETAFIGKWHMGNDDTPRPGFVRWVSFKGQGSYINPEINEDGKDVKPGRYITDAAWRRERQPGRSRAVHTRRAAPEPVCREKDSTPALGDAPANRQTFAATKDW
jgi:N-acetylglucosamine-6-sulfatase